MILFIVLFITAIVISIIALLLRLFSIKVLKNNNRHIAHTILALLILQFILGMLNNFFVDIPKVQPYLVFHYFGPVLLHTINALLLIIFSIFYLRNAKKNGDKLLIPGLGNASIWIATIGGLVFVNFGQNDWYSFLMSIGFIGAFLAYTYGSFAPLHIMTKKNVPTS